MARSEPAIFISHKGALAAGMCLLLEEDCREFTVRKHKSRGEMKGYLVVYKPRDGGKMRVLNEDAFGRMVC